MKLPTHSNPELPADLQRGDFILSQSFADGLRPDPKLTVSQWADQYRYVSQVSSSEPGLWRTQRTPYLREIMDCLSVTSPVREVVLKKGTQVGGTECINNWVGYIICHAPAPSMMVLPTSNAAKRVSKQRIKPLIEESPELAKRVKPARERDSGNTTNMKEFAGGVLVLAGANSATELKSMPSKNIAMDELDEYPADLDDQGDPVQLAEKRASNFPLHKIAKVSSPTVKGFSRITDEYERSDQRKYYVPCPHCNKSQELVWQQMRWQTRKAYEYLCTSCGSINECEAAGDEHTCPDCETTGPVNDTTYKERDTREVLRVWYECQYCRQDIDEHHKTWMLEHGEWVAQNAGPNRAAGFHISALYSPLGWYSWREAVVEYLESETKPTKRKVWTNTVLGLEYEDEGEQPDHNVIKLRSETYRQATIPAGGLLLVASVDVQADRLEAKVKAYGREEESWLVDYQVIHGVTSSDEVWKALDEYLLKDFSHEGGAMMRIAAAAVDSGYNTQMVYDFCRTRRRRHVFPVKGRAGQGLTELGTPSWQDVDHRGRKIKKGVKLWPLGVDTIKKMVYDRLNITEPGPRYMHFPFGLPDDYFEQLTAEKQITRYPKGFPKREWVKDPNARNEALDLEVYCYAAALYAGLRRVNWDKLEQRLQINQPDIFNTANQEEPESNDTVDTKENKDLVPTQHGVKKNGKRTAGRKRGGFATNY